MKKIKNFAKRWGLITVSAIIVFSAFTLIYGQARYDAGYDAGFDECAKGKRIYCSIKAIRKEAGLR